MITIAYLADHPETIPTLASWFRAQWAAYYASQTPAEVEQGFYEEAARDGIPVRLVAFNAGELAGTIVLRERAISSLPEFQPGLGGLLVSMAQREQGIGTELVRAGMDLARRQGYAQVYATTAVAGGILERLGWQQVKTFDHDSEQQTLYRSALGESDPASSTV